MSNLDAQLLRVARAGQASQNPSLQAKAIAVTDPVVRSRLLAVSDVLDLVGVWEVQQTSGAHEITFIFTCGSSVECRRMSAVVAKVTLADSKVGLVTTREDATLPPLDGTFTPFGALPFLLAAESAVPNVVVDAAHQSRIRAQELAYFSGLGLLDEDGGLPRGWARPPASASPWNGPPVVETDVAADQALALILADENDIGARVVARQVERLGGRPLIADPSRFPNDVELTCWIANNREAPFSFEWRWNGSVVRDCTLSGVWRRPAACPTPARDVTSPPVRAFCQRESEMCFNAWLHLLGRRVINPIAAEHVAEKKVVQLAHAVQAGFRVPDTAISNSSEHVQRQFARGPSVFKSLGGASWTLLETRRAREEHAAIMDTLRHAPIITQAEIENKTDVRVVVVDDRLFPVTTCTSHPVAAVDYRTVPGAVPRPCEVPDAIANRIRMMMRQLGLRFGALDFALDPRGEYVFLEVNPRGTFLMEEIHAGHPITVAIAEALLNRKKAD